MTNKVDTSKMTKIEWLKERQKGIGGSDVAGILGLSKFKSPLDIYLEKTAEEPIEQEDNAAMKAGRMLEDTVARWFIEETQFITKRDNKIRIHKTRPYLIANVDRVILGQEKGPGILEIKTTSGFYASNWETEIPEEYYLQLQHYLNVTGYKWGAVAVLIDGRHFKYYYFDRDEDLIEYMNQKLEDFWKNNVEKRVPPVMTEKDVKNIESEPNKEIEAKEMVALMVEQIKNYKEKIAEYETKKEELETTIKIAMQEAEVMTYQGKVLVTWKQKKGYEKLDSKKLKTEQPEIYSKYMTISEPTRTFIIK